MAQLSPTAHGQAVAVGLHKPVDVMSPKPVATWSDLGLESLLCSNDRPPSAVDTLGFVAPALDPVVVIAGGAGDWPPFLDAGTFYLAGAHFCDIAGHGHGVISQVLVARLSVGKHIAGHSLKFEQGSEHSDLCHDVSKKKGTN